MDFRNKAIAADAITSTDANKSIQRSLTKACARHGLGLYIYEGEDLPEEVKKEEKKKAEKEKTELEAINEENFDLAKKLCANPSAKQTVTDICKKYNTTGNPRKMTDIEQSKKLQKELQIIESQIKGVNE